MEQSQPVEISPLEQARQKYAEHFYGDQAAESDRRWRVGLSHVVKCNFTSEEAQFYIRVEGWLDTIGRALDATHP